MIMTNWLSEIEGRIKNKYAQALDCGEGDLALDVAIADGEVMARVLRELASKIKEHQEVADARACPCRLNFKLDMSNDAKELIKGECSHPNAVSAVNKVIMSGLYCPDCKCLISEIGVASQEEK